MNKDYIVKLVVSEKDAKPGQDVIIHVKVNADSIKSATEMATNRIISSMPQKNLACESYMTEEVKVVKST